MSGIRKYLVFGFIAGLVAGTLTSSLTAFGQDVRDKRDVLYLFNQDYPPAGLVQHPSHPVQLTSFWQLLDKHMANTESLVLTEKVDEADYRVSIKCAGITHCSKLKVYLQTPQRDVLSAFTLRRVKPFFFAPSKTTIDSVARRLAERLQKDINQLSDGGFGYTRK